MITTDEIPEARMRELERSGATCAECRGSLTTAWGGGLGVDGWVLRCRDPKHRGVYQDNPITPFDVPGFNLYESKRRRDMAETNLVQAGATPAQARQMAAYHNAILTQEKAVEILKTVFPGAPSLEMTKAAMICYQYELNPLMGHVFLIPFEKKEKVGETWKVTGTTWATVLGIKATRLMAAKGKGSWGYLDDTPRVMTDAEQVRTFGQAFPDRLYVIVKIQNDARQQFTGTGWWPKDKAVKGGDKGNSIFNMASIRAERNALEKMAPGRFDGVITMDEVEIAEARAQAETAGVAELIPPEACTEEAEGAADEIDWDIPHDPPAPVIIEAEAVVMPPPAPKPGFDTQWVATAVQIIGWKQQDFYKFLFTTYKREWPGFNWPDCSPGIWRNIVMQMPAQLQTDLRSRLDGMVRALDSRPGGRK